MGINNKIIESELKLGKSKQDIINEAPQDWDRKRLLTILNDYPDQKLFSEKKGLNNLLIGCLALLAFLNAVIAFGMGIEIGIGRALIFVSISLIIPMYIGYLIKKGIKRGYTGLLVLLLLGFLKGIGKLVGIMNEDGLVIGMIMTYYFLVVVMIFLSFLLSRTLYSKLKLEEIDSSNTTPNYNN